METTLGLFCESLSGAVTASKNPWSVFGAK